MEEEATVTPASAHLTAYVERHIERARRLVETVLRPGHPRPDELHDLHRDLRRLRVIATWRRKVNPPAKPASLDELAVRLRRVTRLVGRVRDLDVELTLWRSLHSGSRRGGSDSGRELATFGRQLQDDSRTGRELLKATLLAELNAGFFERLKVQLAGSPSAASTRALAAAIETERRRLARRAARTRRRALRSRDEERLHEFRVLVRRVRYLSDLEDHLEGRRRSSFPPIYAKLVRRLGDLHDRDVLAAHLDALDPDHRAEAWSQRFHDERRRLAAELRGELKRLHPKRHLGDGLSRRA